MTVELLRDELTKVVSELNSNLGYEKFKFEQQEATPSKMSVLGGCGRIRIVPSLEGYDVSPHGKKIEKKLSGLFKILFQRAQDGFKQSGSQPFWRTPDFNLVRAAILLYSISENE